MGRDNYDSGREKIEEMYRNEIFNIGEPKDINERDEMEERVRMALHQRLRRIVVFESSRTMERE